ncbi:hypothetical protein J4Q44_G00017480 [Coregonus suidteri]|uniref:Uncharacterized protein n=1 Tax=Coregonus suidteri TaxID=861788 RepID=A0AAN8R7D9_9TELE
MASVSDNMVKAPAPQNDETDSSNTQLLEDLQDQLVSLKEQMDLCNTVLKDLVDLRGILREKKLSDGSFPAPK